MLTPEAEKAVRDALAKMTPGPWFAHPGEKYDGSEQRCNGVYPFPPTARCPEGKDWTCSGVIITDGGYYPPRLTDAAGICLLRNTADDLLAELDAARKREEKMREALESAKSFLEDERERPTTAADLSKKIESALQEPNK